MAVKSIEALNEEIRKKQEELAELEEQLAKRRNLNKKLDGVISKFLFNGLILKDVDEEHSDADFLFYPSYPTMPAIQGSYEVNLRFNEEGNIDSGHFSVGTHQLQVDGYFSGGRFSGRSSSGNIGLYLTFDETITNPVELENILREIVAVKFYMPHVRD